MAAAELLFDTDVLIEFLRGRPEAVAYIENLGGPPSVSVITVAELYAGVREGKERRILDAFVSKLSVFELTNEIAIEGGLYRRDFGKSHGVGLSDAIIAATAKLSLHSVVTFNRKHFPMLEDVVIPYER
jgi:predicted nucleic acid-binding protein